MMSKNFKHSSRLFEKLAKNFIAWNKGKKLSEECKRKISKTLSGRKLPKKTRAKMSASKKGKLPNFAGHHHSAETR